MEPNALLGAEMSQRGFVTPLNFARSKAVGAALIAGGLTILLAAAWLPAIPVVGALAIVAFGATMALIDRLQGKAGRRAVVTIHLFIYMSLYLLFVGAVGDAAMRGPRNELSFLQWLDFGASALVMLVVVRLSFAAIMERGEAPAR
jgi:hypothetical protein